MYRKITDALNWLCKIELGIYGTGVWSVETGLKHKVSMKPFHRVERFDSFERQIKQEIS